MIKRDYENVKKVFADLTDEEMDSLFDLIMFGDGFYECPVALKQAFSDAPVQFNPPDFDDEPVSEETVKAFRDFVDEQKKPKLIDFDDIKFIDVRPKPKMLYTADCDLPLPPFTEWIRVAWEAAKRVEAEERRREGNNYKIRSEIVDYIKDAYDNDVKWDRLRKELRQRFDLSAEDAGDIARAYLREAMDFISINCMWDIIKETLYRTFPDEEE